MDISTKWTPEERLRVINRLSERLQRALRRDLFREASFINETINLVSFMDASFLEANRNQILEGITA